METKLISKPYSAFCFFLLLVLVLLAEAPVFGRDKTTTAAEYQKKYAVIREKTVGLPSGAVFKITSIDQRTLNQLLGRLNLSMAEYNNLVHKKFEKMSPKEVGRHMDFWEAMIVKSVVEPEMCLEPEAGKLDVRLLTSEDMDKLQDEIGKLNTQIPELPLKPLSSAPARKDTLQYTVGRLLAHPEKFEGKSVDVYGEVDGELSDIGIVPRQGNRISLQRFYLSDGKNKLLIVRFYTNGERLHMKSFFRDIFQEKGEPVTVHIKKGQFTAQWIDEPVVIAHGDKIDKIKVSWIETARRNIQAAK
ncbi:MAG: hypothetical protein B6240_07905 [Desulfobacteraceae bacterium 4572_87]|nr:MAG: hypothetical protein B6240_07905 [Desulfobacteraceae bacterium 4572_87]